MAIQSRVSRSPFLLGGDFDESVDPEVLDELSRATKVEGSILYMSAKKDAYAGALLLVRS